MTVSNQVNRVEYDGDGVSTVFSLTDLYFILDEDIQVYLRSSAGAETLLTLVADYTLAGAGDEDGGGSVTMSVPPASGEKIVAIRNPPLTQEQAVEPGGDFPSDPIEKALDKAYMISQRLDERIDRSVTLEETATDGDGAYSFGGNRISDLGDPTDVDNASTKGYVDETLALVNAASGDEAFTFVPPSGVTGTVDAIVLTAASIPAAVTNGYKIRFIPEGDNTAATTIQLKDATNDWGAIALVDRGRAPLTGSELVDRVPSEITYSAAEGKFVLGGSPPAGIADGAVTTAKIADDAVVTEKIADGAVTPAKLDGAVLTIPDVFEVAYQLANGVSGGAATPGAWTKVPISTSIRNDITGASLATNVVTLPAGTYDLSGFTTVPGKGTGQARLRNTSDNVDVAISAALFENPAFSQGVRLLMLPTVRVVIAAPKTFELQYYADTAGNLGTPNIVGAVIVNWTAWLRAAKLA